MRLSDSDRELIADRLGAHGLTFHEAHLTNAGRLLVIEMRTPSGLLRSAADVFLSPHRARREATEIPWHELTAAERAALVSQVIAKLRVLPVT
jgi:hypothetical protein